MRDLRDRTPYELASVVTFPQCLPLNFIGCAGHKRLQSLPKLCLHSDAHGARIREEWNLQYEANLDESTLGSSKFPNVRINAVVTDALLKQTRRLRLAGTQYSNYRLLFYIPRCDFISN
jgi:hypothetical protein